MIEGLGIGDWGLGIGDWGLGESPCIDSPLPPLPLCSFLLPTPPLLLQYSKEDAYAEKNCQ